MYPAAGVPVPGDTWLLPFTKNERNDQKTWQLPVAEPANRGPQPKRRCGAGSSNDATEGIDDSPDQDDSSCDDDDDAGSSYDDDDAGSDRDDDDAGSCRAPCDDDDGYDELFGD